MKHLDFILLDVLCLQLSFVLACFLRLGKAWPYGDNMYRKIAIVSLMRDVSLMSRLQLRAICLMLRVPAFWTSSLAAW
ncbi:MAG: hypothetical protein MR842_01650 [Clostridiales bacterium]|nr:hypothetical protein [Clostridiales bacterium]